ncbi:MAG: prolyl oligopeptidase family serine peptidase [Anaerolineae bacterium]|nr:prolyl oligopeptidase family serine peptidase [Anaerolineae bacterium]
MPVRGRLGSYDAIQAMLAAHPPRLAFDGSTPADYQAWRAQFHDAYRRCLGPWPTPVEPNLEVVEERDFPAFTATRLHFDSAPGVAVSAYLLVPKGIAPGEKRPGILAAHGHGDGRHNDGKDDLLGLDGGDPDRAASIRRQNLDYAKQAAERGYVVIVPDWLPFGERKAPKEWVGGRDRCNVVGMGWAYLGYTMLGQNIWDGMRALDILATRPEVDAERLGVIGLSYGGTMTLHLAANDPRLKVAVMSGYLSTVRGDAITKRGGGNFCLGQHVPELLLYGDIPDMAGLIAPKPLLIEAGQKDTCFIIEDARAAYRQLERIYRAGGHADRLAYDEHPYEHRWHGVLAWDWLERWL